MHVATRCNSRAQVGEGVGGRPADLDGIKGHADAGQLNADVVSPAVLHQGDGSAASGRQLPEGCVLQNLQAFQQGHHTGCSSLYPP